MAQEGLAAGRQASRKWNKSSESQKKVPAQPYSEKYDRTGVPVSNSVVENCAPV